MRSSGLGGMVAPGMLGPVPQQQWGGEHVEEVLVWGRENWWSWVSEVCVSARRSRVTLEVLPWARGHGVLWDNDARALAARGGYVK